jgi:hypothetical protein
MGAVKRNRSEMFLDVGGAAQMIRDGADPALLDKLVQLRGTWSYLTGSVRAKTSEDDPTHYDAVVYATQNGFLALQSRIKEMGLDNFRKQTTEQLRTMAYEITDAQSLTYDQAQGLQNFYAKGKANAAAKPLVAQLKTISEGTVRPATPEELAARAAKPAPGDETTMLAGLRSRAQDLGGAGSLTAQLKARAEKTDSLRGALFSENTSPATERSTEAQLQQLFYANPHLTPKK